MRLPGVRPGGCVLALTAAMLVLHAAACSVAPPAFMSVDYRLVVQPDDETGARDERLSVFASVSDGDGVNDLEYLYVIHDGEELCWTLTMENWERRDEGSSVWLGLNGLDSPGTAMPRGVYRLVLVDRAGQRAERNFSLSAPETSAYDIPSIKLSENSVTLVSPYPANTAFFIDAGGNIVRTAPLSKGTTSLDSLWPDGAWRSGSDYLAVYGLDPKAETGFFSWKIRLPD